MSAKSSALFDPHHPRIDRRAASPWIAVADRLPLELVYVLTWNGNTYHVDCVLNDGLGYGATHWMPIPDLPKPTETA